MTCRWFIVVALVFGFLLTGAERPADAQFRKGLSRTEVKLSRKRAPKVYLTGTAIRVEGVAQSATAAEAARQAATMLEAELTSHDPRLTPVAERPDTSITLTLIQVEYGRTSEQREVKVRKNGATVTEYQNWVVITGRLNATFLARDAKTNTTLDSDSLAASYRKEFLNGQGAPPESGVTIDLVRQVVNRIVPRLTPTVEVIEVLLARPDEIDELNKLGEQGLWSVMLEKLEATRPLTDKKRDAYRLYNFGVANEALAYATNDLATAKRLLEEASSYYSRAMEANDDEKYFREPQARIAEAIAGYSTLEGQIAKYQQAQAQMLAAAAPAPTPVTAGSRALEKNAAPSGTFTNASVIALMTSGLDEANTLAFIKAAESVDFDFTPTGLTQLLSAKVPNSVIAAMRARQTGSGPAARTTPAAGVAAPKAAPAPRAGGAAPVKPGAPPPRPATSAATPRPVVK